MSECVKVKRWFVANELMRLVGKSAQATQIIAFTVHEVNSVIAVTQPPQGKTTQRLRDRASEEFC